MKKYKDIIINSSSTPSRTLIETSATSIVMVGIMIVITGTAIVTVGISI